MGKTTEEYTLPAVLDLFHVEELAADLLAREALPATVDISAVEKITTPGIQLLISLIHTAEKLKYSLQFVGDATTLCQTAGLLGLQIPDSFLSPDSPSSQGATS